MLDLDSIPGPHARIPQGAKWLFCPGHVPTTGRGIYNGSRALLSRSPARVTLRRPGLRFAGLATEAEAGITGLLTAEEAGAFLKAHAPAFMEAARRSGTATLPLRHLARALMGVNGTGGVWKVLALLDPEEEGESAYPDRFLAFYEPSVCGWCYCRYGIHNRGTSLEVFHAR